MALSGASRDIHGGGGRRWYGGRVDYIPMSPQVFVVPPPCPDTFAPVRGTDGQVYDNICFAHQAGAQVAQKLTQKQAAKIRGFSGGALSGTAETEALRAALVNLAKKIPSANPGAPQPGDPGRVTDQMILALASVAGRVPNLPSEVKLALQTAPAWLPLTAINSTAAAIIDKVRQTLSRLGSQIAGVINAYARYLGTQGAGGGSSVTAYPPRTISTWDVKIGRWRIAVPKDSDLSGPTVCCAPPDDLGATPWPIDAGTYEEIGTGASATGTTQVTGEEYKKATSTPFYKAWWFWVPVGVGAAAVTTWALWPKKKR